MHVKSGDTVVVIAGKDKGKKGKVLRVFPNENRVIVEGVNMLTKHKKAQGPTIPGGIVKMEGAINASNVMYFCEKDKTGVRVGHNLLADGSKVRVCKKCGEVLDK
ncbi:LSU ribosomal protein L24P [Tissierella praeacuta DSM 18095]|uniref:Large ribosomal subunit protein uL24 n=1 Tax=Tissierella praeacuta DSM 18095 TaxID=1123404 RepID=A0A1M4Y938_9FIRM|nr:50S ribosomal protein L24 [Tissierella praeacuta]SHF02294.1 LSU ribosomal protein L24P [Tissierella praeacuta DSM 18095]SUP03283.1 HPB12 [Tissierella praeacuta]